MSIKKIKKTLEICRDCNANRLKTDICAARTRRLFHMKLKGKDFECPCEKCLIKVMCSEPCQDYADYLDDILIKIGENGYEPI